MPISARLRKALPTLGLVLVSGLAGFLMYAQVMTTVTGTIIGKDGKPVQGAEIRFDRTDIRATYNIKTNRDGKFTYATLPQGIYTISVRVNGETVAKQEGMRTNPAQPIPLNLDLGKIAAEAATATPAPPKEEAAKGPTKEEIEAYEKAKKENEDIAAKNQALNDVFNTAMQATNAKNWNVAIENFTKAAEIDATQHVVFARLGEAYRERAGGQRGAAQLEDFQRAADAYSKAVALLPTDANYRNNYAIALARGKKMDEAQIQTAEAIKLNPTGAGQYYRNLGTVYFDTGQIAPAEETFKKAIEADPKNPDSYFRLGLVLVSKTKADGKLVDPAATESAFKKYLELAPNGAESENAKALLQAVASMK